MMFDFSTRQRADTALVCEYGTRYGYAHLQETADALRPFWKRGELVFCLCSNTPGSVMGYVAMVQCGEGFCFVAGNVGRVLAQLDMGTFRC